MSQKTRASVCLGVAPRQHLEGVGVGHGEHVALLDAAEAVDRRAVERHPVLERVLQLGRADGEALQAAEHVGEPQADQPHAAFLHGVQHVVALLLEHHGLSSSSRSVANMRQAWARLRSPRRAVVINPRTHSRGSGG